jgi:chaperonin GroEL
MILRENETKEKLIKGVNLLADTVKVTLGAKGRTVMFNDNRGKIHITKDGVTVAKNVHSDDDFQEMAIMVVREAAENTVKSSGDGTTTTIVLAQHLINEGYELLKEFDYTQIARAFDDFRSDAISYIKDHSIAIEEDLELIKHVATISSNSEEIGDFIHKIIQAITVHGAIEVKETQSQRTRTEQVNGIKISKGFYAPQFCNNQTKMTYHGEGGVAILVLNDRINSFNDILPYINIVKKEPLLILANDVDDGVLNTIIKVKMASDLNLMIVENDGFGDRRVEIMNDIAALTSATVVDKENKDMVNHEDVLGICKEVFVNIDSCSIVGGHADQGLVDQLIADTNFKLENEDNDPNTIKYYRRRLASLAGGVAVIHVGGTTEVEMKERKDRIDDAVEATRAAINMGVSLGGGYTLYNCFSSLRNRKDKPYATAIGSLTSVINQLAENSDKEYKEMVENIQKGTPIDLKLDKSVELSEFRVYDPTSVLVDAITNAVAVAKSILSVKNVVFNESNTTPTLPF